MAVAIAHRKHRCVVARALVGVRKCCRRLHRAYRRGRNTAIVDSSLIAPHHAVLQVAARAPACCRDGPCAALPKREACRGIEACYRERLAAVLPLVTIKLSALLVPFEFCTVMLYWPGVTRRIYIGHAVPGAQYGASDEGIVNVSVCGEFIGTLLAATLPSINMVLLEVNPKPVTLTVVPTAPDVGDSLYSDTDEVGVGVGTGLVPQLMFWISARVSGPTKPVDGTPCAA